MNPKAIISRKFIQATVQISWAVLADISAEVDRERDFVLSETKASARLVGLYTVKIWGSTRAHSSGSDLYWTDGNMKGIKIAVNFAP